MEKEAKVRLDFHPFVLVGGFWAAILLGCSTAWYMTNPVPAFAVTLLFGVVGLLLLAWLKNGGLFYRPPEQHVGVIYRAGRFHSFVRDTEWAFLLPGIDSLRPPISLAPRAVTFSSGDLLPRDEVPVQCRVFAVYRPNPFEFPPAQRAYWVTRREALWDQIVRRALMEATVDAVPAYNLQELCLPRGRHSLRQAITERLQAELNQQGLHVLRVVIEPFRFDDEVRRALARQVASRLEGEILRMWIKLLHAAGLRRVDAVQTAVLLRSVIYGDGRSSFNVRWFAGNLAGMRERNGSRNHRTPRDASTSGIQLSLWSRDGV